MKRIGIVGGGVGGLSAGIYLQKYGFETVIFEKQGTLGGNLTGWDRQGYHIDNCMHWLNGTRPGSELNRLWREVGALGEGVSVTKLPYFYRSEYGGESVSFYRNTARTRREMLSLSPIDKKEIDGFFHGVAAASRLMNARGNGESIKTLLSRAPTLLFYARTTLSALSKRFRHPLLARLFTDYIGGEFSSLALILAYSAFVLGDADLPAGGSRAMAKRIEATYRSLGGSVRAGTAAVGFSHNGKNGEALLLSDGSREAFDGFVFATAPAVSFGRLLPPDEMPKRLLSYYKHRADFPIFSAFQVAFAADTERLPFRGCVGIPVLPLLSGHRLTNRLLLREFSHEPGFAPSGKSIFQTWIFQREDAAREWIALYGEREAYKTRKEVLCAAIGERIATYYPELSGKLTPIDVWTPATYARYFSGFYGAFLSFAVTGRALPLTVKPALRHLRNAALATQWQSPPGGLPGAVQNGKRAADYLAEQLL